MFRNGAARNSGGSPNVSCGYCTGQTFSTLRKPNPNFGDSMASGRPAHRRRKKNYGHMINCMEASLNHDAFKSLERNLASWMGPSFPSEAKCRRQRGSLGEEHGGDVPKHLLVGEQASSVMPKPKQGTPQWGNLSRSSKQRGRKSRHGDQSHISYVIRPAPHPCGTLHAACPNHVKCRGRGTRKHDSAEGYQPRHMDSDQSRWSLAPANLRS